MQEGMLVVDGSLGHSMEMIKQRQFYREKLVKIYKEHHLPEHHEGKIAGIDEMLQKFSGKWPVMLRHIQHMHGIKGTAEERAEFEAHLGSLALEEDEERTYYRREMEAVYRRYRPASIKQIDTLLHMFEVLSVRP